MVSYRRQLTFGLVACPDVPDIDQLTRRHRCLDRRLAIRPDRSADLRGVVAVPPRRSPTPMSVRFCAGRWARFRGGGFDSPCVAVAGRRADPLNVGHRARELSVPFDHVDLADSSQSSFSWSSNTSASHGAGPQGCHQPPGHLWRACTVGDAGISSKARCTYTFQFISATVSRSCPLLFAVAPMGSSRTAS